MKFSTVCSRRSFLSILMFSFFSFHSSCDWTSVEPPSETIIIEGTIKDELTNEPLPGVEIRTDAIKSSSGMGIITNGRRKRVGETSTDNNGNYSLKLKVFKDADRLEFYLNPGIKKEGYVELKIDKNYSEFRKKGINSVGFSLWPIALLKIKFKNSNPVSGDDFFYFGWYTNNVRGWPKGIVQNENCGSVIPSSALTWTGVDVCGSVTAETFADRTAHINWNVRKNGIMKQYKDSVYVKRGIINELT
ncbi:hypothetical protein [Desertivirga brevis]|uniref:hypothetical protein n=1 Tax=Desertivirga brevis TaxID=2810310 RepID=UPI001A973907|nr:hypothetical protein [Pedobacter sp. SYSU D00873]